MNCPYCDESVHLMSKFCPKCGLPLKEDATVMGAYATDDTGPSIYVLGGGAAALLAIALLIGWASSQNGKKPVEQVQRQQITSPAFNAIGNPAVLPASNFNPAASFPSVRPTAPPTTYKPQVKWAYTPPPNPPAPVYVPSPPPGPEAPAHNLAQEMAVAPKRRPVVEVARATEPIIPLSPAVPAPLNLQPGQTLPEQTALVEQTGASDIPRLTEEGQELERRGIITWDPVQERYVIVPGRQRRNNRGYREIAPRSLNPTVDATGRNVESQ